MCNFLSPAKFPQDEFSFESVIFCPAMAIRIHTFTFTLTHIYTYTPTSIRTHISTHTYRHTHLHTHFRTNMYTDAKLIHTHAQSRSTTLTFALQTVNSNHKRKRCTVCASHPAKKHKHTYTNPFRNTHSRRTSGLAYTTRGVKPAKKPSRL